jgi:hypothetical protein
MAPTADALIMVFIAPSPRLNNSQIMLPPSPQVAKFATSEQVCNFLVFDTLGLAL